MVQVASMMSDGSIDRNQTIDILCLQMSHSLKKDNSISEVVLVKICNDLLPTATTLPKCKWQSHDSCCRCAQQQTRDHMIQCPAQSRTKWRIKTMTTLQKRIKQLNTKFDLENTLCCALPEWFGRGHVPLYKYPEEFHKAIWSQGAIGWKNSTETYPVIGQSTKKIQKNIGTSSNGLYLGSINSRNLSTNGD